MIGTALYFAGTPGPCSLRNGQFVRQPPNGKTRNPAPSASAGSAVILLLALANPNPN
jgi:hypothetical protein